MLREGGRKGVVERLRQSPGISGSVFVRGLKGLASLLCCCWVAGLVVMGVDSAASIEIASGRFDRLRASGFAQTWSKH